MLLVGEGILVASMRSKKTNKKQKTKQKNKTKQNKTNFGFSKCSRHKTITKFGEDQ